MLSVSCNYFVRSLFKNNNPIGSEARRILKYGLYGALPTDKDGGFIVLQKAEIMQLHEHTLQKHWYKEVSTTADLFDEVRTSYIYDCKMAAKDYSKVHGKDEGSKFLGALLSSVKGSSAFTAKLKGTMKTHKHEVTMRPVHAQPVSPMASGMQFNRFLPGRQLKKLDHLVRDSKKFASKVSTTVVSLSALFVEHDLKDYYLSGTCDELANISAQILPMDEQLTYKKVCRTIIDNQFIDSDFFPGRVWKVRRGCGMGMLASGEIADSVFYILTERDFLLNCECRDRFGIHFYFRFRGDLWMCLEDKGPENRFQMMNEIKRHSQFFEVKCMAVSRAISSFLDIHIEKGDGGRILTGVHFKDTSIYQPLAVAITRHTYMGRGQEANSYELNVCATTPSCTRNPNPFISLVSKPDLAL